MHQRFADTTNTRSSSFGLLPLLHTHWLGSGQAPAIPVQQTLRAHRTEGVQAQGHSEAPCLQPMVLGFPSRLTWPTGHMQQCETQLADEPHATQSISEEPRGPQPAQKDTVMRNPPKRNMKTKSAVLPRKEPSSSMRQYLYLRAGEKGGV